MSNKIDIDKIKKYVFETYYAYLKPSNEIRPMIDYIKKNNGKDGLIGVEIGVAAGVNALSILKELPIKKLYLIDPYEKFKDRKGRILDFSHMKPIAYKKLQGYMDKIMFIHKSSLEACSLIPDVVDFIYIDGNHTYNVVREELKKYFSKVSIGGVFGGHDFSLSHPGVAKAVLEFLEHNNLKSYGLSDDWWIIKR